MKSEEILTCLILVAIGYFIAQLFSRCAGGNGFKVGAQTTGWNDILRQRGNCEGCEGICQAKAYRNFFESKKEGIPSAQKACTKAKDDMERIHAAHAAAGSGY